jgi:hypothetical protein
MAAGMKDRAESAGTSCWLVPTHTVEICLNTTIAEE